MDGEHPKVLESVGPPWFEAEIAVRRRCLEQERCGGVELVGSDGVIPQALEHDGCGEAVTCGPGKLERLFSQTPGGAVVSRRGHDDPEPRERSLNEPVVPALTG